MIKNALFTFGCLISLCGFGWAGLLLLAALGNPAPSAKSDHRTLFYATCGIGLGGVAMVMGACLF